VKLPSALSAVASFLVYLGLTLPFSEDIGTWCEASICIVRRLPNFVFMSEKFQCNDLSELGFVRMWRGHSKILKGASAGKFNVKVLDQYTFLLQHSKRGLKLLNVHFLASKAAFGTLFIGSCIFDGLKM